MAACKSRREKKRKTIPEIMAVLAYSEKQAKDTLNRVRVGMNATRASYERIGSKAKRKRCSNDEKTPSSDSYEDIDESGENIEDEDAEFDEDSKLDECSQEQSVETVAQSSGSPSLSKPMTNIDRSACMAKTMDLIQYYMNRISFQCECHFAKLTPYDMSKDDRLHCRRFHSDHFKEKKEKGL